ncbi:hypothetical protein BJX63DRAFT_441928 [Aspergillus granulosus]|uniref:Uncharacterized protein n=1 Tax=Aspergillus granulosus TaxID=176169 RepID=A0ABR4GRV1_9EURO
MEEIRQALHECEEGLETNKRMLDDIRRRLARRAVENRNRRRSDAESLRTRQRIISDFANNILHPPSHLYRQPVSFGYGDVALDVHIYEKRMRTDFAVFEELNCDDILTALDYISPTLFDLIQDLARYVEVMGEMPHKLDPRSEVYQACNKVKSALNVHDVDIPGVLYEFRAQNGQ